ncbi:MAG TPA: class I SAM-dependent methyltransferase [Myxococcota bacterium]|nr:class I SAM-dependent methyltransferase [Myxococcota bacterium]
MTDSAPRPHSAENFGEERNFWWNDDFLELTRRRLAFPEARSLVDVGCGQCHWTAIATELFPAVEAIVGVDFEAAWVEGAEAAYRLRLERQGRVPSASLRFVQGDAHALPLPDASADVVTCQTVLMHLSRPAEAVAEMFRVVRPGGLVLVAEPENSFNFVRLDTAAMSMSLDELTAIYRFRTAIHMGRAARGSDWDIGHRLVGMLEAAGGVDVQAYTSDRVNACVPPYASPIQRASIAAEEAWGALMDTDSPTRRTHEGWARDGGLGEDEIARGFELEAKVRAVRKAQMTSGTWHHGGGFIQYIAWARRG